MIFIALYVLVGVFAGLAAGLLGVGGGIVNVPALDHLFARQGISTDITFHLALGTSLAIIIVTSSSAVLGHHKRRKVDIPFALKAGFGGVGGAVLGGYLASLEPASVLRPAFGVLLIAAALKMFFEPMPKLDGERRQTWLALAIGLASGLGSGFFGIGGGIVAVPLLIWLARMQPPVAVATSSLIIVILSIFGAATYAVTGWAVTTQVPHALGYIHLLALIFVAPISILTARLGVRLAHRINPLWLKRLFAAMLLVVGGRFLWIALSGRMLG
jgi:uncharacterized protein